MSQIRLSIALASVLLVAGVGATLAVLVAGPLVSPALVLGGTSLGLYVDLVSAVLLTFIAGLSLIVSVYSRRNLRGQAGLSRFGRLLIIAQLSLALLVTAASLPVLALGWTLSGLAIAGLVGHRGTATAGRAAWFVRRRLLIADALLWSAVIVALFALPSTDRAVLSASVAATPEAAVTALALLLVLAAAIRSALLPSTSWLYETAEAPSPISALLHAGVVNAVGLLGVLLWPILAASAWARGLLIVLGIGTAVVMSLAIRYRADVKGKLAASTSAQMGYLSVQVGLGLPLAGMLHLIGHGMYKAHLFLRAGGQVSRARHAMGTFGTWSPSAALGGTALATLGLVGLLTWTSLPLADLLPISVATAAAAVAGYTVLNRSPQLRSSSGSWSVVLAATAVPIALATYLVILWQWTQAFGGFGGASEVWPTPALVAWLLLLAAAAATVLVLSQRLQRGNWPALRAHLSAIALPPLARVRSARLSAQPAGEAIDGFATAAAVAAAGAVVGPAWPLKSVVAANPLVGLQDLPVTEAASIAAKSWGARTSLSRETALAHYRSGRITDADLTAALRRAEELPQHHTDEFLVHALVAVSQRQGEDRPLLRSAAAHALKSLDGATLTGLNERASAPPTTKTLTEQWDAQVCRAPLPTRLTLTEIADLHAATWLLDLVVANADVPPTAGSIWQGWRDRVTQPGMDRKLGVKGFGSFVAALPADPAQALTALLQIGVPDPSDHIAYLGRLLARNPGWSAHLTWRAQHGDDLRIELLAVRAAYDVLLADAVGFEPGKPEQLPTRASHSLLTAVAATATVLNLNTEQLEALDVHEIEPIGLLAATLAGPVGDQVWEEALASRYRNRVLDRIAARADSGPETESRPAPLIHLAMCIDVRSERFRRHLEAEPAIDTYGFAGFFGLAVHHEPTTGPATDQCPVLIRPSVTVAEATDVAATGSGAARLINAATAATSNATLTPFALAEASAPVVSVQAVAQTLTPRMWGRLRAALLDRSAAGLRGDLDLTGLDTAARVQAAYNFLHSIGLESGFGEVIVVAGHGAQVENNAFAAAYDCGACGGNAGYVNARILATLLNDDEVRMGLADHGINLPEHTRAIPAMHQTTTDELIIDDRDVPASASAAVAHLRSLLEAAQTNSVLERVATLPGGDLGHPAREVARRSMDWAEPTPEWGLAGNALFVAGPRWLTRGLNLHGRSFLHSYEPRTDTGYRVLETIMSAPLVVAHWINSQYYASTVDPQHFGAGDKTTHNVVGDIGVLSGAHGDLRVGLPWQGLFDVDPEAGPATIAHEPMRLQALLYASPQAISGVLEVHPEVARLVSGNWLSMAALNPEDGQVYRLGATLQWTTWDDQVEAQPVTLPDQSVTAK